MLLPTDGSTTLDGTCVDDASASEPELGPPDVGDALGGESPALLSAPDGCELPAELIVDVWLALDGGAVESSEVELGGS